MHPETNYNKSLSQVVVMSLKTLWSSAMIELKQSRAKCQGHKGRENRAGNYLGPKFTL